MRRLNAVSQHEKFVASGVYKQTNGLLEHWSCHDVDGASLIRIDIDGRAVNGHSRLLQILRSPDGSFERIDMHDYLAGANQPVKNSYVFSPQELAVHRVEGKHLAFSTRELPAVYTVSAGSWLMWGWAIHQSAKPPSRIPLLQLQTDSRPELTTAARVSACGEQVIALAGADVPVVGYEVCEQVAWLDRYAVLICVRAEDNEMVRLTQYARRPEVKQDA